MPTEHSSEGQEPISDIATAGWAGITVRIAWALLAEGVRLRPDVLRDTRDHVFYNLHTGLSLVAAEDRAGELTSRLVARARRKTHVDPWPQDSAMPISPRWKRAIDRSLTPITSQVFRQHYGDGRGLESLEKALQVDRIALEAARGGLREVLRRAGMHDGLPFDNWPTARLDRLLKRLAAFAPGPCPPAIEVAEGHHRAHIGQCIRCERTYRLVQGNKIAIADLLPPVGGNRPTNLVKVLAVHVHPDVRQHRDVLVRELVDLEPTIQCFPVGEDVLLLDAQNYEPVKNLLQLAAEVGKPSRDHIRAVLLEGPGRWSSLGLLGPVVESAEVAVRSRSWGSIDGMGELPAPLPPPPSAKKWWIGVGLSAMVGIAATIYAVLPGAPDIVFPLDLEFTAGRGGVWGAFDVEEGAHITIVREASHEVQVVLQSDSVGDKATLATGDGAYRFHAQGEGALIISSPAPIPELEAQLAAVGSEESPLDALAERIRATQPVADVQLWRP